MDLIRDTAFFLIPTTKVQVASIDVDIKNSYKNKKLIRIVDKLDIKSASKDYVRNFEVISKSKLLTKASVKYLEKVLSTLKEPGFSSTHLNALFSLIGDEKLMNKLGKPVELKNLNLNNDWNATGLRSIVKVVTVQGYSSRFIYLCKLLSINKIILTKKVRKKKPNCLYRQRISQRF